MSVGDWGDEIANKWPDRMLGYGLIKFRAKKGTTYQTAVWNEGEDTTLAADFTVTV